MTRKKQAVRVSKVSAEATRLESADDKAVLKLIRGQKNALSARGIAQHLGTNIQRAKRIVERLRENHPHLTFRHTMRREGDRGTASRCYFVEV